MTVHCHRCGSCNLRPSHFRWVDLAHLALLRSPVRCRYCRTRFYVTLGKISGIRREAEARIRQEHHMEMERLAGPERQNIPGRS
ncbi:MAG: hypothetical protein WBP85_14450 [Terracidiphilus sp.]